MCVSREKKYNWLILHALLLNILKYNLSWQQNKYVMLVGKSMARGVQWTYTGIVVYKSGTVSCWYTTRTTCSFFPPRERSWTRRWIYGVSIDSRRISRLSCRCSGIKETTPRISKHMQILRYHLYLPVCYILTEKYSSGRETKKQKRLHIRNEERDAPVWYTF